MFLTRLHSGRGDPPYGLVHVDFWPLGRDHHIGARAGQDREFERRSAQSFLLAQLTQEGADLGIWEGGEVFGLLRLVPGRQYLFEMTTPPGWVFTRPITASCGPIEDCFNSSA